MYLILLLLFQFSHSEDTFQEVVERGIRLYNNGEYERALKVFEDAENINPNSYLVDLEIAMTYFKLESYKKAYIYSKKVLESGNKELRVQGYIIYARSMFNRMQKKEAIKTIEDAIIELGDNDLLYYCLGDLLLDVDKNDESIEALKKAIKYNYLNIDCHYLLSVAFYRNHMTKDDIFSSLYYLLLEPNKHRSLRIMLYLKNSLISNNFKDKYIEEYGDEDLVKQNSLKGSVINKLYIKDEEIDNYNKVWEEFVEKNGEMKELEFVHSEITKLITKTEYNDKYISDITNEFYLPFFKDVLNAGHLETFCHYISYNISNESSELLNDNPDKINSFMKWLQGG